jgi:hypothetical protein
MFTQFLETVAMGDRERRVCRARGRDWTWQARPCGEIVPSGGSPNIADEVELREIVEEVGTRTWLKIGRARM